MNNLSERPKPPTLNTPPPRTLSRPCSRSNSWSSGGSDEDDISISASDDDDVTDVSPLTSPCIISAKVNNRFMSSSLVEVVSSSR